MSEHVDAVIVGARCAGSATAIAFARAGKRVLALDSAKFPSDTLSTHLMFAGSVAELATLGALGRVEELGAPRLPLAHMEGAGIAVRATYTPVGGVDYGLCVRRTGLDAALVETARQSGAEVREGTKATELIWDGDRAVGVRTRDRQGRRREIRASLVVGADGRRSMVARQVGADDPYRLNRNERACLFAYWRDPWSSWRSTAAQWRDGAELGTAFPCDDGLLLVLLMPPVARAAAATDVDEEYERTLDRLPGLRARLRGCTRESKVRSTTDTPSYFRRSAGPGWALPGDAGHFKDPVTAQGIRDALRYGRLLGEACAPVIDDPHALDDTLRSWELQRERECLEVYQWTNALARAESMSPLEVEFYRAGASSADFAREALDVFSRVRSPGEVLTLRRGLLFAARAFLRSGADRAAALRTVGREMRVKLSARRERAALRRAV